MDDPRAELTHACLGSRPPVVRYESAFDADGIAAVQAMAPGAPHSRENVCILPGGVVPRAVRRRIDRRGASLIWIESDVQLPAGAPGPASFDDKSIRWALSGAALGVVWSAGWSVPPELPRRIRAELIAGGRVVEILTRAEHEWDWLSVMAKYGPPTMAPVLATAAEGVYHA